MEDAMVAGEDRRFRYHPGVDPVGLARAGVFAVENYGSGRRMQGASTITQQLARNVFLSNSYTWSRKLREMVLALALEWKFSKDQILDLYLKDRKSVVEGKSVSVRVDFGVSRIIQKKKKI